jgi:predicted ATPase
MRIKKLELKNGYKRFNHLTIDLGENPKRFVALVGPNGCGKSSVLDGMLFIHNAYGELGQHTPHLAKGSYHSQSGSEHYSYTNIVLEMETGLYQDVRNLRNQSETGSTMFSFRSPYRFNNQLNVQSTKAMPDIKLNGYGAQYSSAMDSKMDDNYRRLNIKFHRLRKKNDWRETETKTHVIGELNSSIKNCLDLEIDDIGDVEAGQGSLFFKKSGQQASFNFNVLSSGEKEVIDILLDLYLREDDYNETIFLIDEPELHINTSIQRKLLIEIDRLVGPDCQIWIATHSIGFLRALQNDLKDDCQVIHFDPTEPYASQPHTLRPIEKSPANWKSIFQTALDDLTDLVSPKRIVYCEGKATAVGGNEMGLDAKVFNQIFSEEHPDTLFVSSGGNTELDQRSEIAISILSKVLSGLEVLVLKDRDMASGKDVSQSTREHYLQTNPRNHRVLKRWELENYLYDKEVLAKYCVCHELDFDEVKFDNECADIINSNLKDRTGLIRSICGIKTSINSEIFKLQLAKEITPDMNVYKALHECIFE